jgi:hypothetical protein
MAKKIANVIGQVVSNTPQMIEAGVKASQGDFSGFNNFHSTDPSSMDAVNLDYIASVINPSDHSSR